ncbi:MAG: bifunctional riboflavin kinase/FAD synthetase [bacterium]
MIIHKGDIPILNYPSCIIPGIFDGLHIGHQHLIKQAIESSKKSNITPILFTFLQHPRSSQYILQEKERNRILAELGIKHLVLADFNRIEGLSPSQYIELLLTNLKIKEVWCGQDFCFGKNRRGNIKRLKVMGKEKGFLVFVIEDISFSNTRISTSLIKDLLLQGRIKEANSFLKRPLSFSGIVFLSQGRGKKFGFPTANLMWDENLFCPRKGVYFVKVRVDNEIFNGIANLGIRPTFDEKNLILETHIFDFNRNIYGKEITIFFHQWIRDEIRFDNENELFLKIKDDKERCRNLYL